ncbi:peptidoglycan-binding protein [Rhizobium sp. NZLR1b]|uniref:peptidoglycan-binding domain-containing protein n=1 Tax=Rhizobium sp. NZLR1b TaxID=2731099 RepID=UPI001C83C2D9|nr:peptidoglycan-binding domain-containing protein [Rhizobium sp. NZLR1b]MBX5174598.1 peptidoglycan-binding protein [Rhizobium sp. NZLR1b]
MDSKPGGVYLHLGEGDGSMGMKAGYATLLFAYMLLAVSAAESFADIRPVRDVQKALAGQGFDAGVPDGIWGAKSISALKGFQRAHDLIPTGVITQDSLWTLFPSIATSTPPPAANTQDAVPAPAVQTSTSERSSSEPTKLPIREAQVTPAASAPSPTADKKGDGSSYFIVMLIFFGVFVFLWGRSRKAPIANGRRRASR